MAGVVDVFTEQNEKGQFNGKGHFIAEDIYAGEALLRMHLHRFEGREIQFDVDEAEDFLQDPLTTREKANLGARVKQ